MVTVACEKCGSQLSYDDADMSPIGKLVACPSCAHSNTVMPAGATNMGLGATPAPRHPTMAGLGKEVTPGAARELFGGPSLAAFDAQQDGGVPSDRGQSGRFIGGGTDLSNLPAPKRRSVLDEVGPSRAAPKSALDLADDGLDLLAPVGPSPGSDDFDFNSLDLPAPVGPSPTGGGGIGLPAPVGPTSTKHGISDLPAPVGPTSVKHGISDLPAPVGPTSVKHGISDLPAPVGPTSVKHGISDLPTPVGPSPSSGADLPAPKGFFDDIPAPRSLVPDPPKSTDAWPDTTASPGGGLDLPAPKGFFDDIPVPAPSSRRAAQPPAIPPSFDSGLDLPAPKGFFDDIPGPAPSRGGGGGGGGGGGVLDLDDLDLEPSQMAPLPRAPAPVPPGQSPLDLGDGGGAAGLKPFGLDDSSLDLPDLGPATAPAPQVPLDLPPPASGDHKFDDLDLPAPPAGASFDSPGAPPSGGGVVTFSAPSAMPEAPSRPMSTSVRTPAIADDNLELAHSVARPGEPVARVDAGEGETTEQKAERKARQRKLRVAIASAAAVILALGAGGYYFYSRYQAEQERTAKLSKELSKARKQLIVDTKGHWDRAASAAEAGLKIDKSNLEARALAAQAYFAAALDEGTKSKPRVSQGKEHALELKQRGATGPEFEKAVGLRAIVERRPKDAVKSLKTAARTEKRDPNVFLYLGWAHALNGEYDDAIKAYEQSLKLSPRRVPALYGQGLAYLSIGSQKEARDAFLAVIERNDQHIGAQVGMVQLQKRDRFSTREREYLAITNRKEISRADPRAVSRAWSLAGDEALRAGRTDEALARYTKALELDSDNLHAVVGEGNAALAQGRHADARERLTVAIETNPNHTGALIAYSEAARLANDLPDAQQKIERALELAPQSWRAHLAHGSILAATAETQSPEEAQLTIAASEEAYRKALSLAPDGEISPTVALAELLVKVGRGEDAVRVLEPVEVAAETDPALAVTLGVAYLGTGDAVRAEGWFTTALTLRADDVEAQLQLGLAQAAQQRWDDAIATLEAAYATEPREDIGVRLAMIYEQTANDEQAERLYGKVLESSKVSLNARARAGRFYARLNKPDKARAVGSSILRDSADHPAGHFLTGEGLYADGKWLEAQREYRLASNGDPRAQYFEGWGRAAEKQQLYDDALKAYGEAIKLQPDYVRPRLGRGRIRVARREFQLAYDELAAAAALDANNWEIHYLLGESFYARNDYAPAAKAYSAAIKSDESHAVVHYRLGLCYVDLDKAGPAMMAFKTATELAKVPDDESWLADAYFWFCYTSRTSSRWNDCVHSCTTFLGMAQPNDARERDVQKIKLRCEAGRK